MATKKTVKCDNREDMLKLLRELVEKLETRCV